MSYNHVRRHIRADACAALDEREAADVAALVHNGVAGDDDALVNLHIAGHGDAVAQHTLALDVRVMSYMALGHDEAVVADARAAAWRDAAVDYHLLADYVVVAYVAVCLIALPAEVLRVGTDDGALIHLVAGAHARAAYYAGVRHDFTAGAYLDILVDVGESVDDDTVGYLCRRVDMCEFAYHCYMVLD